MEYEERPWGEYWVLEEQPTFKVKRIKVNPNQRLSYQYHKYRAETWVVVQGIATVTLNDEITTLNKGESITIPLGAKHRVANTQTEPLVFIEIQNGTYFGEDDIIRLFDDYSRT